MKETRNLLVIEKRRSLYNDSKGFRDGWTCNRQMFNSILAGVVFEVNVTFVG